MEGLAQKPDGALTRLINASQSSMPKSFTTNNRAQNLKQAKTNTSAPTNKIATMAGSSRLSRRNAAVTLEGMFDESAIAAVMAALFVGNDM